MEDKLKAVDHQIGNLVKAVAMTGNISLSDGLTTLEKQKSAFAVQLETLRAGMQPVHVSEEKLKAAVEQAREAIQSGDLPEIRKVINLYLKKVTIHRERVEAEISALPEFFVMPETQVHVYRG